MKRRLGRRLLPVFVFSLAALFSPAPFACGPFIEPTTFTRYLDPDGPMEDYVGGRLGILQPTYARVYLYVAYRQMSDKPFSAAERDAVLAYWRPDPAAQTPGENWIAQWMEIEANVLSKPKPAAYFQYADGLYHNLPRPNNYETYLNCPMDAFHNAVHTFSARQQELGTAPALSDWVHAQSTVFSNCGAYQYAEVTPPTAVPAELPADAPARRRADRDYQIAAALFYSEQFDAAAARFDAIAKDSESPWEAIAPYLAARAFIRKWSLGTIEDQRLPALAEAERRLRAVLADPGQNDYHLAAQRMLNYIRFRTSPAARLRELAASLQDPAAIANRQQDMIDYTRLLDGIVGDHFAYSAKELAEARDKASADALRAAAGVLMNEWIVAFQSSSPETLDVALRRWEETHSLPWLAAAISKVHGSHPSAEPLLAAAGHVSAGSTAYATVAFHAIRLLAEKGRDNEARTRLDAWLAITTKNVNASDANLLRAARLKLARNSGELLHFATRISGQPSAEEAGQNPQGFDIDFVAAFNHFLPLEQMAAMSANEGLPAHLHRELVMATWTRAVLLGRHELALKLADEVARVAPEMRFALRDYRSADSAKGREFATTYALLSFPGLRPFLVAGIIERPADLSGADHWRNNWWCDAARDSAWSTDLEGWRNLASWESRPLITLYTGGKIEPPAYLSEPDTQQAAKEKTQLTALPTAPNYLAARAADWARQQPKHPLVPESLHRAVMSSRWGCTDEETGQYSREAFRILHQNYPDSPWASKTKYWYGNEY